MLRTTSLFDILLAICQTYPITHSAGAFVSHDPVMNFWFLIDLRYSHELAMYHDGDAGIALFSLSASSYHYLTTDIDFHALESWIISRPDCLRPSPQLPSLRYILTMFKGTQNLVDA